MGYLTGGLAALAALASENLLISPAGAAADIAASTATSPSA